MLKLWRTWLLCNGMPKAQGCIQDCCQSKALLPSKTARLGGVQIRQGYPQDTEGYLFRLSSSRASQEQQKGHSWTFTHLQSWKTRLGWRLNSSKWACRIKTTSIYWWWSHHSNPGWVSDLQNATGNCKPREGFWYSVIHCHCAIIAFHAIEFHSLVLYYFTQLFIQTTTSIFFTFFIDPFSMFITLEFFCTHYLAFAWPALLIINLLSTAAVYTLSRSHRWPRRHHRQYRLLRRIQCANPFSKPHSTSFRFYWRH